MSSYVPWGWQLDTCFRIVHVTPSIPQACGYTAEEVLGKTPFEFMPSDEGKRALRQLRELACARRAFLGLPFVIERRNNDSTILLVSGQPILDSRLCFHGFGGVAAFQNDLCEMPGLHFTIDELLLVQRYRDVATERREVAQSALLRLAAVHPRIQIQHRSLPQWSWLEPQRVPAAVWAGMSRTPMP